MGDGRWAMPSASPSELVQSKTHLIITTSAVGSGDVLDSDRQVHRLRKIWGGSPAASSPPILSPIAHSWGR